MTWFKNGVTHRDNDLPAVICKNGTKEWWVNGQRHREDDKPAIVHKHGMKKWYYNNMLHRSHDKPAIVQTLVNEWWIRGKRHRNYGKPAEVWNASEHNFWWLHGKPVSEKQAKFIHKRQNKIFKKYLRIWLDITYENGKPGYYSRLEREMAEDMEILENDIGYKFELSD